MDKKQEQRIRKMLDEGHEPLDIAKALRIDPGAVWRIKNEQLIGPRILLEGKVVGEHLQDAQEYIARFEANVEVTLDDEEAGHILGISGHADPEQKMITLYGPPTDVTCLHEIAHVRTSVEHDDAWAEAFRALLREAGLPKRWRAVPIVDG